MNSRAFQKKILGWYQQHGRKNLPWRTKPTPYRVMVSEIMLQQTQVDRVQPFFKRFMAQFPTVKALAGASQPEVLALWKGLGYNRRALALHRAAKEIYNSHNGRIPESRESLEALPGIGPYTAGAIRVFAYNLPDVFIETNIRRVMIHHFFKDKSDIHDRDIMPFIEKTMFREDPRLWYGALMDYGTDLASQIPNPNKKSRHYVRQSQFEGSDRKIRGKILAILLKEKKISINKLARVLGEDQDRVKGILDDMVREGFCIFVKNTLMLCT